MGSGVNIIRSATRNFLMNSIMDHRQRLGIFSSTITTSNAVRIQDRWRTGINNGGFFTSATQGPTSITNPTTGIARQALNFSSQASNAGAIGLVQQRIESYLSKELASKKASMSFLVRNNNFTTVTVNMYYPTATDNYTSKTQFYAGTPQVFTASGVVKFVKVENIPIHASAINGIEVEILYSGFSVGIADDTALSEVMLNEGETVNPFIPFAGWDASAELAACMRYCETLNPTGVAEGVVGYNGTGGTITASCHFVFKVRKRVTPAITVGTGGVVSVGPMGAVTVQGGIGSGATYNPAQFIADAEL